jgi:GTP-binding protein LepA
MPLAEVITDFFNSLKSATKGYASMGFEIIEYRPSDLVRLDVKINYEVAPPLACICHRDKAQSLGRKLCASLKEQ